MAERYNVIRPTVARDFYESVGAPKWAKYKIVFRQDSNYEDYRGTKYYRTKADAEKALKAKQNLITETRDAAKKPPVPAKKDKFLVKVGKPTKTNNVIKQKFKEVIGSRGVPETYKPTGVIKNLYRALITVDNKTVLSTDFGKEADAIKAVKNYRIKNPIKNPPPDLKTLDERKKKRYTDKKIRQGDIKTRGGIAEGGPFKGNVEVHKGHAGNIRGKQLITGDKVIRTPGVINQMMSGDEGTVIKNRFTDLDYKIGNAEKEIERIQKSNMSAVKKKKLLAAEDAKLIKYASQSDGYKVVRLSDGNEFRLPGKSLQTIDPFDIYPGLTEVEINKELRKYLTTDGKLKPLWTKQIKDKTIQAADVENIKKAGIFMQNMNVSKEAGATALENFKTIYANEPDGSAFRKAMDKRVNCADGCFIKVANKNPEKISKLLSTGKVIRASDLPQPPVKSEVENIRVVNEFMQRNPRANIKYNTEAGTFVNTQTNTIDNKFNAKAYAENNPIDVKAGTEDALKPIKGNLLKTVGKSLAYVGAPLPTALIDTYFIGKQISEDRPAAEIAKDPLNWLGLATMSTLSEISGVSKPGKMNAALRLGMSPGLIRGVSRFAGIPGLAISTALTAYDQYQKYQNEEGLIYDFFNKSSKAI